MKERKPSTLYPGYWVTEDGDVFSSRRKYDKQVHPRSDKGGYLRVVLTTDEGIEKCVPVHKLVAETWIGPRPSGLEINHRDGDKTNNHYSNLEYCTRNENAAHAATHGLYRGVKGARNNFAKLSETDALSIIDSYLKKEPRKSVAARFGITVSGVAAVWSGRVWAHLPRPFVYQKAKNPTAISEAQKAEIAELKGKMRCCDVARKFKCSHAYVSKLWAKVDV